MTVGLWLKGAEKKLIAIPTARLDSLVLLEDFTKRDRSWLLAHPDFELGEVFKLDKQLERRAKHEPLAYIRGKSGFYGREFIVNEHTLEPRPETETMIELALDIFDKKYLIFDIGTGSGAIAITMKLELTDATVVATDIDKTCIEIASKNSASLRADVKFYTGNLLEPLSDIKYQASDIAIMANLPYVPDKYQLNEAAKFEPKHAVFGGQDGLDLYRQLFIQIKDINHSNNVHKKRYSVSKVHGVEKPEYVLTESLPFQHQELGKIAEEAGYELEKTEDFIQVFRINPKH